MPDDAQPAEPALPTLKFGATNDPAPRPAGQPLASTASPGCAVDGAPSPPTELSAVAVPLEPKRLVAQVGPALS